MQNELGDRIRDHVRPRGRYDFIGRGPRSYIEVRIEYGLRTRIRDTIWGRLAVRIQKEVGND